ncbi:MAG TPA: DNA repair exonuclease [Actinobacteria bacterium]|nr:DNA repair exonuclease [Actinomycetota bacterium]
MAQAQVRIVHAADIHLDSSQDRLSRLNNAELEDELNATQRGAFDRLIKYCLDTAPDALVLAGDLYDGDWKDFSTGLYFVNSMRDLHDANIPVVIVQGNHDAESVITRTLQLPPNVHVMSTDRVESWEHPDGGVIFHGQGFATKAVRENLARDYPFSIPGLVNVGVLHTSVAGYAGHDTYAPCSVQDLTGRGYEYFALGHIHRRTELNGGRHAVWFSGNLQGRGIRETGPKGALDVVLTPGGEAEVSFVELDVARWEALEVDVTGIDDFDEAMKSVLSTIENARGGAGDLPLVVRITLRGTCAVARQLLDRDRVTAELQDQASRLRVGLDKVSTEVALPPDRVVLPERQRTLMQQVLNELQEDASIILNDRDVSEDHNKLHTEIGRYLHQEVGINLKDDDLLQKIVLRAARRAQVEIEGGD